MLATHIPRKAVPTVRFKRAFESMVGARYKPRREIIRPRVAHLDQLSSGGQRHLGFAARRRAAQAPPVRPRIPGCCQHRPRRGFRRGAGQGAWHGGRNGGGDGPRMAFGHRQPRASPAGLAGGFRSTGERRERGASLAGAESTPRGRTLRSSQPSTGRIIPMKVKHSIMGAALPFLHPCRSIMRPRRLDAY